jgi:hypothetical protein
MNTRASSFFFLPYARRLKPLAYRNYCAELHRNSAQGRNEVISVYYSMFAIEQALKVRRKHLTKQCEC